MSRGFYDDDVVCVFCGEQQLLVGSPGTGSDMPQSDADQQYQTSRGRNVSKYVGDSHCVTLAFIHS